MHRKVIRRKKWALFVGAEPTGGCLYTPCLSIYPERGFRYGHGTLVVQIYFFVFSFGFVVARGNAIPDLDRF